MVVVVAEEDTMMIPIIVVAAGVARDEAAGVGTDVEAAVDEAAVNGTDVDEGDTLRIITTTATTTVAITAVRAGRRRMTGIGTISTTTTIQTNSITSSSTRHKISNPHPSNCNSRRKEGLTRPLRKLRNEAILLLPRFLLST